MADRKREREETPVAVAIQELDAAVGRDTEMKVKSLSALRALVDPSDESYEMQKEAANAGVLPLLMQLLEDDSTSVMAEAAETVAALTKHSKPALVGLHTPGMVSTKVEKVPLNPVQQEVAEVDGMISVLVNLRFNADAALAEAAEGAIAAITALHRDNQVAYLQELVHRLVQGEPAALEALHDFIAGIDIRDDAAVLLDQALSPALGMLRKAGAAAAGGPELVLAGINLLGSICEARRGAGRFLVMEGALPLVTGALVEGDMGLKDASAHLLWLMLKDQRRLLSPHKDALGVKGTALMDPLLALVEAGAAQMEARDKAAAARGSGSDDEEEEEEEEEEEPVANGDAGDTIAYSDDAVLLLRALAGHDVEVAEALKGKGDILGSSCAIM